MTQTASPPDALALNQQGARALAAGNFDVATDNFRQALTQEPRQPAIWLNLAAVRRAQSDFDGALNAVDEALRINPRHFMALLSRASLLDATGEEKRATAAYAIALTQAPSDSALDPPTLATVKRARDRSARHAAELETFVRDNIARPLGECGEREAHRLNDFIGLTLGSKKIYRQDPVHFYYPGLPTIEFYDRAEFPWLSEFEAATDAIRDEFSKALAADLTAFVPYIDYPDTVPVDQWAPLNKSKEWSAYHLIYQGQVIDQAASRCPATMAAISRLPQPLVATKSPAAMFSALRPHTRIPPHTGIANTRLVVHLPLVVPAGCGFRVGNETRAWKVGEAWVFDDTIEHEAWNDGDALRTILICDIWNPRLSQNERAVITRIMTAMDVFNGHTTHAEL